MPAYGSFGGLDDQILSDGDAAFVGMNQRLQPNQLKAGEVVLSKNGRIDGYWQPRKGIQLRSGTLSNSAQPLVLPFYLVDSSFVGAISSISVVSTTVTITLASNHGVLSGSFIRAVISGITGYAGTDPNGTRVVEITGDDEIEFTLSGVTGSPSGGSVELQGFTGGFNVQSEVNGGLTTDGTTGVSIPSLLESGTANGKPQYVTTDGRTSPSKFYGLTWTTSGTPRWLLSYADGITSAFWQSTDNTATPDLASTWTAVSPATGTPSFADGLSSVSASREDNIVTIFAPGHGLDTGTASIEIVGFETTTSDPNGRYDVTVNDNAYITYSLASGSGSETYSNQGSIVTTINNTAVSAIYGSCLYSDPTNNVEESIVLATNLEAKRVALNDYSVTSIPYPSDVVISEPVELIQAFDKVFIFRDGERGLEWIPLGRPINSGSLTSNLVTLNVTGHGLTTGDQVTLSGITFTGTDPNGLQTVTFATSDTFTFALTSADETYGTSDAIMVASGFTKVQGGPYTAPQSFSIEAGDVDVSDGLLTADVGSGDNTTIKTGDFVSVHFTEIPELTQLQGNRYEVVEADDQYIKFYVPAGEFTGTNTDKFDFSGRFSQGGGFTHQPALPWAVYFQRRLWGPYLYATAGTTASPTYASRDIWSEIVVSDILDSNTFDQIYSQFSITAGISDYIVAMQPFYDDNLMVFNRNSIHLIRGTQGTLADTVVTELTREIGCLARKSVVSKGNNTFFLSDSGVYGVEFIDEYNLRGTQEPLSKNIQPFIDRINKSLADKAVGVFFNNRYWLAVPLDSSKDADDAPGNNAVLIFNTLNGGWESIDTYEIPEFNITNFHIGQFEERNALYLINETGGIHEVDSRNQAIDSFSTDVTGGGGEASVDYELVSRGYQLGESNYERKKFHRAQVQLQSDVDSSDVNFYFSSEDPDTDKFLVSTVNDMIGTDLPGGETGNFRMRLGNPRGLYGTLTISANLVASAPVGRPKVNSIVLDGTITNRQTISQY
jgi:hypothetical protein